MHANAAAAIFGCAFLRGITHSERLTGLLSASEPTIWIRLCCCRPPSAADFGAEAIQSQRVRWNCMVLEVSIEDLLKPCANDGHGFVPQKQACFSDDGKRCRKG